VLWVFRQHNKMSPNFDFRFWGARGAPKGAPKIEVHGTYPYMVSSKHPGTPTPTIFVPLQKINSCFGTSQMAPDRTLQYSDAIHLLTFNPDTVQTCSLVRIGVARTESKLSVNSLFASIATAVSDRCWLGLSELLTSPLIIAHLHLTG